MTNPAQPPARWNTEPGVPGTPLEWAVGAAAFAVEIALAGTVAVVGYRWADGGALGWILAVVALAVLFVVWGRWMSPRAPQRLPLPGRLVLGSALTLAAAAGIFAGSPVWGVILAVVGVGVGLIGQPMLDR